MDQRTGQVVHGVEQAQARHQVEAFPGERPFLVDRHFARAGDGIGAQHLGPSGGEGARQLPGPVADHQRPPRLGAQEGETLEDILDHVLQHEACGLGAPLQQAHPPARGNPAGAVENDGRERGAQPSAASCRARSCAASGLDGAR